MAGEGAEAQHNPMSQFLHLNMLEASYGEPMGAAFAIAV